MEKPDLNQFPLTPGVYLYKDEHGKIIYVGKAIKLRNRLASYFRPDSALTPKTRVMLQHARTIDILQTTTEKEALLLEASLIKKHRPRYNICLRDDKEYIVFRIQTKAPFPRLEIIRKSSLKGDKKNQYQGKFYGPFSSALAAKETWRLIHRTFPLRRCRDRAFANRTRTCLYHHMGQCLGPCVEPVSQKEYAAMLHKVDLLLSGRSTELIQQLEQDMHHAAEDLAFEQAARLRDQIAAVKRTVERQSVVLSHRTNIDVIGVAEANEGLALGVLFVREGLLLDGRNFFWPGLSLEETPELLETFLTQFYLTGKITPPAKIILPWLPEYSTQAQDENENTSKGLLEAALAEIGQTSVTITTPATADEDRLAILAAENAKEAAKKLETLPMPELLQRALKAPTPIYRIEAVDISHTGGTNTRAGMVVFENGQPTKNDYRQYALDEDLAEAGYASGDDYAALSLWAKRRATAGAPWPDLILIDGGKGQLAAVERVFQQMGLGETVYLAAITKARDEEGMADRRAGNVSDRIFLPSRSNPLPLKPGSSELLYLQRVRDAVHDYALGRHRQARSKAALTGELTRLPGIGPKTAKLLYEHFGSLAAMTAAGAEGLQKVPGIGSQKATMLAQRLQSLLSND